MPTSTNFNRRSLALLPARATGLSRQLNLHEVWPMFMNECTKGEPVPERGRHVRDGNIPVAIALDLTPLLKCFHGCHPAPVASSVVLSAFSDRETNKRTRTAWSMAALCPLKCDQKTYRLHPSTQSKSPSASYCRVACLWDYPFK